METCSILTACRLVFKQHQRINPNNFVYIGAHSSFCFDISACTTWDLLISQRIVTYVIIKCDTVNITVIHMIKYDVTITKHDVVKYYVTQCDAR